jgi:hypothetical protein
VFVLQCAVAQPPETDADAACRRDAWYSATIRLVYRYPRPYLAHALAIESGLFRILDSLKAN